MRSIDISSSRLLYFIVKGITFLQNKTFTCLSMASKQTFTRKQLYWSLFYKNAIKKRLQQRCFTVNIVKFLRTTSFIEIFPWLLFGLKVYDNLIGVN